jgi:hypothetical protein
MSVIPAGTQKVYDISQQPYNASTAPTADNTNAINKAVQDAFGNGGGVVYIPSGTWRFSGTLNLPFSVSIVGDGQSSQLLYQGGTVAILWQDPTAGNAQPPRFPGQIADLLLTSNNPLSQIGIKFVDVYGGYMNRIIITSALDIGGFSTAGVVMVSVNVNTAFSHLNQCTIHNVSGDGIQLQGETVVCSARECQISANGGWGVNGGVSNQTLTISSGTYNSLTGVVTLTMSSAIGSGLSAGNSISVSSLTGTGALSSLQGTWTAITPTSGTTVTYNAGPGLGSITINGGSLTGGYGVPSSFSVYNCDLEGNLKGGITGKFTVSEFEGNYYENTDIPTVSTTLAAPITALATTLTVTSAAGFPPPNFYISIGSEILLVTATGGTNNTTWTVVRHQEGTAAAAAAAGALLSYGLPRGGPAFLLGACQAISIKGNRIENWLGPYGMDIGRANGLSIGSGIDGCIVEGNQVSWGQAGPPFQNVGSVVLVGSSGSNVRMRNNQIVSRPTGTTTTTHVQIANWAPNIDAGLRMSSFRFAAHDLQRSIPRAPSLPPPPPRQLAVYVPLDTGVATFPTIAMEEPGYVVAVVARLTSSPSPGNWTVLVQFTDDSGKPIPIPMTDALGNPILVDITEQTAEGRPSPLGLYDEENDLDNQFPTGAQLGVTVSTSANWPVGANIDVVVDVIVGFGGLGV